MSNPETEMARRWRLILGADSPNSQDQLCELTVEDQNLDRVLSQLYDPGPRSAGMGGSQPVARWLGDIRSYFPSSVVKVMQQDAVERLQLKQLLLEPEILEHVEPNVHLVATLLSLNGVIPAKSKDAARQVVRRVVEDLEARLANPLRQAVTGSLNRATRNNRPRHKEIDWNRTIRANLRHYQPELNTVIPHRRIGFGRKRNALRDIILCLDQSGSMGPSVVYSGIFGSVLASMPAIDTKVVAFDTNVVDLTEDLHDPVDVLFGVQLGGGTDINRALTYCQSLITRPTDTILVLISDLYEGGLEDKLLERARSLTASGVNFITLLALSDDGKPAFDHQLAEKLSALGVPSFACTPDLFPELMAAAIQNEDISSWAAARDILVEK